MSNQYFTRRKGDDFFTSPSTETMPKKSDSKVGVDESYLSKPSSVSSGTSSEYGSVRTRTVKKTYAIRKN